MFTRLLDRLGFVQHRFRVERDCAFCHTRLVAHLDNAQQLADMTNFLDRFHEECLTYESLVAERLRNA